LDDTLTFIALLTIDLKWPNSATVVTLISVILYGNCLRLYLSITVVYVVCMHAP